ncbi:MAG: hypothetical protein AB1714_17890 [Acidobacteriota bacterium]
MSALWHLVRAQVEVELTERLRAPATVLTVLASIVLSFLWLPDPKKNVASVSWTSVDGVRTSGAYNSAYLGLAIGILVSSFLTLVGFYLIAGSVRKDREKGVGAILAATQMSKTSYLLGKLTAHFAYLLVLSLLCLVSGFAVFLRYGTGSFGVLRFVAPSLLLAIPGLAITAACALLFDVTPGLRSRGGLILWFFFWSFVLVLPPLFMPINVAGYPIDDPAGIGAVTSIIERHVPEAKAHSVNVGLEYSDKPFRRVMWEGVPLFGGLLFVRVASLLWLLAPFALAVFFFDRFDPARQKRRADRPGAFARLAKRFRRDVEENGTLGESPSAVRLAPVAVSPARWRAVAAEARMIWDSGSFLKWPLLGSAVLAAVIPAGEINGAAAALLILLAPLLSEVAAREELTGTRALVHCQPAVPSSTVIWKLFSTMLFVVVLGLPAAMRAALSSPQRGLVFLVGLLFVAAFATGAGALTRGGKLFSGIYVGLWYASLQKVKAVDFCGISTPEQRLAVPLPYLASAAVLIALALFLERRRAARD